LVAATTEVGEKEDYEDKEVDDDIDWSDDGLDPEEKAAQLLATVESFESQKKLQDDACAREEDNNARVHRGIGFSLQREEQRRGGDNAA
jgi:hypothetical protein